MRVFLLDLWLDLREKRLAPLAILLLAAIIAVPIVLAKDEQVPETTTTATTATTAAAAPVVATQASEATSSKLQTFSPRDPFEPTSTASSTTTSTSTSTSSSSGTSSTGGGTTGTGTSEPAGTGGGGATTGTEPSTGTGNGTGTGTGTTGTGNTTGETKTTVFTYTVDVRFGEAGDVKAYKQVKRLDLIPTSKDPKLVFLGVTTTGKTAVFLVDSNIGVDTAGKCRPSNDECTFLYLRPDDDHAQAVLTDADGTVYHIRLLGINRVSVSSSNGTPGGSGNSGSGNKNSSKRSPAFTGTAKDSGDDATVPGGASPPGENQSQSSFQQFFADSASDSSSK